MQNEKSEILAERKKVLVFGCFVCFVSVTAEKDAISLSLSLFSFAKNMYAHAHVFLAKKRGK